MVGAGKGGGSREAAQGQTTINPKAIAIADLMLAVEMAWRRQWGSHGSGDGGASMGPTMTEGWPMWGGGHLLYYYLHKSMHRCNIN
jgi:hypothetical protein